VPGAFTRVSGVTIMVDPGTNRRQQVPDDVIRRIASIDSGDVVRERALVEAQLALYQTDAYAHVLVTLDSTRGTRVGNDSVAPVRIALIENPMHAARLGAGYGTLDCFRASAELEDYNFLGRARRLGLQGRVSKIGIGEPLNGAPSLCPDARRDVYSTRLNYYLGATFRQPYFFGIRSIPTFTAYTARVSEYNAYVRTTAIGGVASIAWQRSRRFAMTLSYSMDFGRTEAQPALFCAVFNLCAEADRERVQQTQRLAVLGVVLAHEGCNNTVSPTRGSTTRLELKHASPLVLSDTALQFNTILGDAARYIDVGGGNVLALHLRSGLVFGRGFSTSIGFIPPQERMYAGGPTSVRGFAQNELGAVTYLARPEDFTVDSAGNIHQAPGVDTVREYRRVVPVGGNSLLVANVELRLRSPVLPELLQFAVFADGGDVWNRGRGETLQQFKMKVTPGIQAAALTPIGPVRVVVGYNPYQRPAGPLYYENAAVLGGNLPLVKPSFQPAARTSLRSRLTFGLAIGQAF